MTPAWHAAIDGRGSVHVQLDEAVQRGRFHRATDDALCTPRRVLVVRWVEDEVTCTACLERARKLGLDLADRFLDPQQSLVDLLARGWEPRLVAVGSMRVHLAFGIFGALRCSRVVAPGDDPVLHTFARGDWQPYATTVQEAAALYLEAIDPAKGVWTVTRALLAGAELEVNGLRIVPEAGVRATRWRCLVAGSVITTPEITYTYQIKPPSGPDEESPQWDG